MAEIILKNITKKFNKGAPAVDNLSIEIKDGDFVTLLGPSGCGKTTTLRMIAGLESPTGGQILINGQVVFDAKKGIDVSPVKRGIGFIFQNYALWPHMTVFDNIAFGLENEKWPKDKIKARVQELLELLRIEDMGGRYPAELSGGQQQRVAIARTLAPSPSVLLMDEPLSNLDAKLRMEMRTELKRLHAETGATFVYVTHDQLEAMTLSTKVCLMKNGVLQQYSPPLQIYGTPNNTFVADFMGNPTINLISCECTAVNGDILTLKAEELTFRFTASSALDVRPGQKFVLGLRPENIAIEENGLLEATVYSSLPSGMETIVQVKIGKHTLNSVVFGSLDFKMGETVRLDFVGKKFNLFDAESTRFLSLGSLEACVPEEVK